MWISKKEYKNMVNKIAYYEGIEKALENRIDEVHQLRTENLELRFQLNAKKSNNYEVGIQIRERIIEYSVKAENHEEAREIAIKRFEKENLALSRNDILCILSAKI